MLPHNDKGSIHHGYMKILSWYTLITHFKIYKAIIDRDAKTQEVELPGISGS